MSQVPKSSGKFNYLYRQNHTFCSISIYKTKYKYWQNLHFSEDLWKFAGPKLNKTPKNSGKLKKKSINLQFLRGT